MCFLIIEAKYKYTETKNEPHNILVTFLSDEHCDDDDVDGIFTHRSWPDLCTLLIRALGKIILWHINPLWKLLGPKQRSVDIFSGSITEAFMNHNFLALFKR